MMPELSHITADQSSEARVAIVHYWFFGHAGGEQVTEALAEMFPQADLFCLAADPEMMSPRLRKHKLTTSFLQRIPGARRWYKQLLPLHPLALEQLDLSDYDLIISSESGPAKGIISHSDTCHICYCLSPMRYLWDLYHEYRRGCRTLRRGAFSLVAHYMRMWDLASAARVDYFAAISQTVASRIHKHYHRDAQVIYPPVDVQAGYISEQIKDYYLVVSRLVDYKRIDLAITVCNQMSRHLRIIGEGEEYKRLRQLAGPTIEFLGWVDDEEVHESYAHCRALLFPGEEDFGIVPVEAQSFGRPVIAYRRGGAVETVMGLSTEVPFRPEVATGIFFSHQTPESMAGAIRLFESLEPQFSPSFIRSSVDRFNGTRFRSEMHRFINDRMAEHSITHSPRLMTSAAVR
jgi:glycosyltransferase involved in cell wall biosynthesis